MDLVPPVLAVIAWGALAFGANYPWAYAPLMIAAAALGAAGLVSPAKGARVPGALLMAMAAVGAAGLAQLVPVPQRLIVALSPATDRLLRDYDLAYRQAALAGHAAHALSVAPDRTRLALACLGCEVLLAAGVSRMLTREGVGRLVRGVSAIGFLVSVCGIVQQPLYAGRIFGFWTPGPGASPFGPFVNKNHFAGWVLMALPLAGGYLAARISRGGASAADWRARVLRYDSREASRTLFVGFAIAVMAIALVMTLSRSGIASLLLAVALCGWTFGRRAAAGPRALATAAVAVALLAVGWVGGDVVHARFAAPEIATLDRRLGAWADACRIAGAFPLAGTGLNTYGTASLYFQKTDLARHYDAAHNDVLQIAAEGGILVSTPAAVAFIVLVTTLRRRIRETPAHLSDFWIRAGAVTGLVAIGLQELLDFSLQIPGDAVLAAVVAGVALRGDAQAHPSFAPPFAS